MNYESIKDIEIIYEDENVIGVNKPSGLTVHPTGKAGEKTLTDWMIQKFPSIENVGEPLRLSSGKVIQRAGLLHRLDKDTSGVLLFAKNQETFLFFKKQFQNKEINKEYRAIACGVIKEKRGIIDTPIGRSAKQFNMRGVGSHAKGLKREAITEYEVLARTKLYSYVSVFPKTGRTHQIRVHLKSIGHPILCDSLYASRRRCPSEMGRLALHAYKLQAKFKNNKVLYLEAPIPGDFNKALKVFLLTH